MKCRGQFTYKGITHIDAGSFVNGNGESIDYKGSYRLQVDEITPNGIFERKIKMPEENLALVQDFMKVNPYAVLDIEFDVTLYTSGAKLTPISFKQLSDGVVTNK